MTAKRQMHTRHCSAAALLLLMLATMPQYSRAHGIIGKRMFVEPLFAEDANIKNELVFPRSEFLRMPDGTIRSFGFGLEKQLWPDRWSVSIEQGLASVHTNTEKKTGFDNLEISTKVAAYTSEPHEFILSPMLGVSLPTASRKLVERQTRVSGGLLCGKGLGDLKSHWLRPLAVQGDVLLEASVAGEREGAVGYDLVVEYSIPYLNHYVRKADSAYDTDASLRLGSSLKALLGDLFPFVEFNGETPLNRSEEHTPTFIRPGVLVMGHYAQVTIAADLPLRNSSASRGRRAGAVIMFDFFLDEISHIFEWTPFGKQHKH
jgi:hypothetical protein